MANQAKYQPLKGFRDFLPDEALKRQWLKNQMIKVFEKWGFEPLETPTLEPLDLFEGQIGEEEKLFYKFQDQGDRWVALRYDQTVPTCRVVSQYYNQIIFPFKRYQIQSAFRAEKPQQGRYREFTQVDVDIFGVKSPIADAQVITSNLDLYRTLGFKKAIALINNRDLLTGIPYSALASIDKLKKIGKEKVLEEMTKKGVSLDKAKDYLKKVENLQPDEKLKVIFNYLKESGLPDDWYQFEPALVRSFSYSEGPIWEIIIPEYSGGSVGGGERYDNLVKKISGKDIPGTGIGIGFDRTLEALEACNLLPNFKSIAIVLVTIFSPNLVGESIKLAQTLRESGLNVDLYSNPEDRLDKQLKYANNKKISYAIIIGPDEITKNLVTLKDLRSRTQRTIPLSELVNELKLV